MEGEYSHTLSLSFSLSLDFSLHKYSRESGRASGLRNSRDVTVFRRAEQRDDRIAGIQFTLYSHTYIGDAI